MPLAARFAGMRSGQLRVPCMITSSAQDGHPTRANSRSSTHLRQIVRLLMAPKRLSEAQVQQRKQASKKRKEAAAARHAVQADNEDEVAEDAAMPDASGALTCRCLRASLRVPLNTSIRISMPVAHKFPACACARVGAAPWIRSPSRLARRPSLMLQVAARARLEPLPSPDAPCSTLMLTLRTRQAIERAMHCRTALGGAALASYHELAWRSS